jgi:diaminopimelate epimerase
VQFAKYHALGNDYAVVEAAALGGAPAGPIAVRLCDRHRGLGADGLLVRAPGAAHRVAIWNPDGSEAEKSGNGLRIFARYLYDRGAVDESPFHVDTAGGRVKCTVRTGGRSVAVEMGRVSFASRDIPVAGPPREVLGEPIEIAGERLLFSAATIGNPHCVLLRERATAEDARRLGPLLERDARFPRRTNVQLVEVVDRARLKIEIWERGAGYTLASGSSACAAAAVTHRLGLTGARVTLDMPGGSLTVALSDAFDALLEGAVARVADGTLSDEVFA